MKRLFLSLLLLNIAYLLYANSPVNFGVNFRVDMPRSSFESTDWKLFYEDVTGIDPRSISEVGDVLDASDIGHAGGAFLRFNVNKNFIHTEVMCAFNTTGISYDVINVDGSVSTFDHTSKTTTLSVPVFIGHNIINQPLFKMRFFTGPVFGWLTEYDNCANINFNDGTPDLFIDDTDVHFNDFSWLWSVGGGLELFMFSFDVRYGFNLNDVSSISQLNSSFNQSTNKLEFTIGFKFI